MKPTVPFIVDTLGAAYIAAETGVSLSSVRNARVARRFPASWFLVVSELCKEAGIECDDSLFHLKRRRSTVPARAGVRAVLLGNYPGDGSSLPSSGSFPG